MLIREVRVHPDRSLKDAYILQHWVQEEEAELKEVSEEGYLAWLQQALMWLGSNKFSRIPSKSTIPTSCYIDRPKKNGRAKTTFGSGGLGLGGSASPSKKKNMPFVQFRPLDLLRRWGQGDLLLPQFGLMDSRSATGLLAMLPAEIEKVGAEPWRRSRNEAVALRNAFRGVVKGPSVGHRVLVCPSSGRSVGGHILNTHP